MGKTEIVKAEPTTPDLREAAKRANELYQKCQGQTADAILAVVELGDYLIHMKEELGHGKFEAWTGHNCDFTSRSARMYMKVAKTAQEPATSNRKRVADLSLRRAYALAVTDGQDDPMFSSKSHDWLTPEHIIARSQKALGNIDLDPCANTGKPNVPAEEHFTEEHDGLSRHWHGRVYMNPPYGSQLPKWVGHLVEEYIAGNVTSAVALIPSRTDTAWFQLLREYPRCFLWGRLKFSGEATGAPFPSMAVYLGSKPKRFFDAFSDIGDIYALWEV